MTALHAADKLLDLGGILLAISDSTGYIHEPNGFSKDQLKALMKIKDDRKARIGGVSPNQLSAIPSSIYLPILLIVTPILDHSTLCNPPRQSKSWKKAILRNRYSPDAIYCRFIPASESSLYDISCDYVFPCAMQNDIDGSCLLFKKTLRLARTVKRLISKCYVHVGPKAETLIKNGCVGVFEGANMACNEEV